MEHIQAGKHGARSTKQAIAIGLSKARRAGVNLPPPKEGKASEETRTQATRNYEQGQKSPGKKPSPTRSRAITKALKREEPHFAGTYSLSDSPLSQGHADSGALITSDYLPSIFGHDAQMVQVFQNLISNAIKYRSKALPSIQVRAQKNEHEWVLSPRDNGVGIRPEYQGTIFSLFKRLHGREIPGTGMGLAICSKIVERHGGRWWVSSQPGEGSEFFFSLPVASD